MADEDDSAPAAETPIADEGDEENENEAEEGEEREEAEPKAEEKEQVLVDRKVIDEKLIREAVVDDIDQDTGVNIKPEDIELLEVTELSLSFKNIYSIDNLVGFEQLVKLQLDNNIIDRIQNLDQLVNLKWLDLSFNNITKIENLEKLTSLTDLSLFNNRLTAIGGLDSLTQLNVLSLGNNQIENLDSIKALRNFPNLRLLNLKGNPVCKNDDYRNTIFAYLTKLKYLDYVLIEASELSKARDSKLDELVRLEAKEEAQKVQRQEEKKVQERVDLFKAANLGGLNNIIDWVMSEDDQYNKLKKLPGYQKIIEDYRVNANKITGEFAEAILSRHTDKCEEKDLFQSIVAKASREAEDKSIDKVQSFEARKKRCFAAFQESRGAGQAPDLAVLEGLRKAVAVLHDELMDVEMLLVEMINDVLDEFEETFMKFVTINVQGITSGFNQLTDVVNWYRESLQALVTELLEKMANENADPETDNAEVTALLTDRDALLTTVATSNDNHQGKIMQRGDEIGEQEDSDAKRFIRDSRQDEYERNRFRVSEIQELVRNYNAGIDQLFQDAQDDEDNMY